MQLEFECLSGATLVDIGHAADMIWVILSPNEKSIEVPISSEICIDIQSNTEILLQAQFLTGTNDIFIEHDNGCLFDHQIESLMHKTVRYCADRIFMDEHLNLVLSFSNGLIIQTLKDEVIMPDQERWRIFVNPSNSPHFVAMGDRVEI